MSVPFLPRPVRPPLAAWRSQFADEWFYILYFQDLGVADTELATDPTTTVRRLLGAFSGDAPDDSLMSLTGPDDGRGLLERLPDRAALPRWLTQEDLDHYGAVFARTGFTGGLNWYRNMDRNWYLTAPYADAKLTVWVQQERPHLVNAALVDFLSGLTRPRWD